MTAAHLLREPPESARTCCVCGVGGGTLGQYIDLDDMIVWAHLSCARTRELEAIDGIETRGVIDDV